MKRVLITLAISIWLVLPPSASADVLIMLTTFNLPRHGVVRGHGSGSGMPVYLVPVRDAPHRYTRNGTSYEPQLEHPLAHRSCSSATYIRTRTSTGIRRSRSGSRRG